MPTEVLRLGVDPREALTGLRRFTTGVTSAKSATTAFSGTLVGLGAALGGIAAARVAGAAVSAAMEWEQALVGVSKTTEFTAEGLRKFGDELQDLAARIPVTANELAKIAETAGQLGIREQNLLKFTETMAALGVTTNLAADQAATALARIANIMQTPQDQFDRMGAAIVDLGNNFATTEAEITEFALRIAGAGEIAGLSESDVLALGTALSSVGVQAEAGGSAMQRVLMQMSEAVSQGNEDLALFAEAAGMSAEEFATRWRIDAAGAFTRFIEGLASQGEQAIGTLKGLELADLRVARSLLGLANAGDLLSDALRTGNEAWRENTALVAEADKFYGTLRSDLQETGNRITGLAVDVGENLTPSISNLNAVFNDLLDIIEAANDALGGFGDRVGPALDELERVQGIEIQSPAELRRQRQEQAGAGVLGLDEFLEGVDTPASRLAEFMESVRADTEAARLSAEALALAEAEAARQAEEQAEALKEARDAEDARVQLLTQALDLGVQQNATISAMLDEIDRIDTLLAEGTDSLEEQVRLAGNREALESSIKAKLDAQKPTLREIGAHLVYAGGRYREIGSELQTVVVPAAERINDEGRTLVRILDEAKESANEFKGVWISALNAVGTAVGGVGQAIASIGVGALAGGFAGAAAAGIGAIFSLFSNDDAEREQERLAAAAKAAADALWDMIDSLDIGIRTMELMGASDFELSIARLTQRQQEEMSKFLDEFFDKFGAHPTEFAGQEVDNFLLQDALDTYAILIELHGLEIKALYEEQERIQREANEAAEADANRTAEIQRKAAEAAAEAMRLFEENALEAARSLEVAQRSIADRIQYDLLRAKGLDADAELLRITMERNDTYRRLHELGIPIGSDPFLAAEELFNIRRAGIGGGAADAAISTAARGRTRNDPVTMSVENISRAEAATLSTIARTQLVVLQQIEVNTRTIGNPSRQLAAENTTQQIAAGNGRL